MSLGFLPLLIIIKKKITISQSSSAGHSIEPQNTNTVAHPHLPFSHSAVSTSSLPACVYIPFVRQVSPCDLTPGKARCLIPLLETRNTLFG